jgi:hypothetical protein
MDVMKVTYVGDSVPTAARALCRHAGLTQDDHRADGDRSCGEGYLTTAEAARHMRRSVSWMLREKDIPYFRGKPNLYFRSDLDHWFRSKRRYEPLASRGRP